ncbi:MAG: bifunctional (p)ppGpp synthetase/guanosine-3',5'-bis(diphosphate) 3'-pyrophosphohydrolase, partial [Bacteroidetes bacterium]
RTSCPRAISLMSSFGSRIVKARWAADHPDVAFLAAIKVVGLDKQGMLNDLIRIISLRMKLNIRKVTIESHGGMFEGRFDVFVHNKDELEQLMASMESLPHVYTVTRAGNDIHKVLESEADKSKLQ